MRSSGGLATPWRYAILVMALLATALQMPAAGLARLLNEQCAGECRLAAVSGPWWAGQGQLFLRSPASGKWVFVGDLGWRLASAARIDIRLGSGSAILETAWGELRASIDGLCLPAELLLARQEFGLPGSGWQGDLYLRKAQARWAVGQTPQASGVLSWEHATLSLVDDEPLGELALQWSWTGTDGLSGSISSPGPLRIRADLAVAAAGRPVRVDGEIEVDPAARRQLERTVRLVAEPLAGEEGRYRLALRLP